jgi:hypothetical protein
VRSARPERVPSASRARPESSASHRLMMHITSTVESEHQPNQLGNLLSLLWLCRLGGLARLRSNTSMRECLFVVRLVVVSCLIVLCDEALINVSQRQYWRRHLACCMSMPLPNAQSGVARGRVVLELALNTEKLTPVFKANPSQKADPLKTPSPTLFNGFILSRDLP